MRVLLIGDHEGMLSEIAQIVRESDLGYDEPDVAPLASLAAGTCRLDHDVTVIVLPADLTEAWEALGEARRAVRGNLVAVGPAHDVKLVLGALRRGADQYVDQSDLKAELEAALSSLKPKRSSRGRGGRIIGVLGAGGGSGASTIAANLAVVLASQGGPTALLDLAAGWSTQDVLLDLKPTHDLGDLCRNVGRLDADMFHQSLVQHASGVQLLAAAGTPEAAAQLSPQGVRDVVALTRAHFPFAVLDVDHALGPEQMVAVTQADLLLLVLRLDIPSLRSARRILDYLEKAKVADGRIWAVANRCGQAKELPPAKVEQALGLPLRHRIPDDAKDMNLAVNAGVPVVRMRPRANVSKSLLRLAAEIHDYQPPARRNGHGPLPFDEAAAQLVLAAT